VVNSGYLVYKLSKLSHHANLGLLGVGSTGRWVYWALVVVT